MDNFLEQALTDKDSEPSDLEDMSLSQAAFNPWDSQRN